MAAGWEGREEVGGISGETGTRGQGDPLGRNRPGHGRPSPPWHIGWQAPSRRAWAERSEGFPYLREGKDACTPAVGRGSYPPERIGTFGRERRAIRLANCEAAQQRRGEGVCGKVIPLSRIEPK